MFSLNGDRHCDVIFDYDLTVRFKPLNIRIATDYFSVTLYELASLTTCMFLGPDLNAAMQRAN